MYAIEHNLVQQIRDITISSIALKNRYIENLPYIPLTEARSKRKEAPCQELQWVVCRFKTLYSNHIEEIRMCETICACHLFCPVL